MPFSFGSVLGALLTEKLLGRALGNISGRMGTGGVRGAVGGARAGLAGMGKMGKAGIFAGAAIAVGAFAYGMYNAAEILGKTDVTQTERVAAGLGNAVSVLTMGLVDAKAMATGQTALQLRLRRKR